MQQMCQVLFNLGDKLDSENCKKLQNGKNIQERIFIRIKIMNSAQTTLLKDENTICDSIKIKLNE